MLQSKADRLLGTFERDHDERLVTNDGGYCFEKAEAHLHNLLGSCISSLVTADFA